MPRKGKNNGDSQACIGNDGRRYVSVTVVTNRAFAWACLDELTAHDGKDRRWMMQHKAITVPADLLPSIRARLEKDESYG